MPSDSLKHGIIVRMPDDFLTTDYTNVREASSPMQAPEYMLAENAGVERVPNAIHLVGNPACLCGVPSNIIGLRRSAVDDEVTCGKCRERMTPAWRTERQRQIEERLAAMKANLAIPEKWPGADRLGEASGAAWWHSDDYAIEELELDPAPTEGPRQYDLFPGAGEK